MVAGYVNTYEKLVMVLIHVIKRNSPLNGSFLEILERYANIGHILDFCVIKESGKNTIITCSEVGESASLHILRYGYRIDKMV